MSCMRLVVGLLGLSAAFSHSVAVTAARRRLVAEVPQHHHSACDACCACAKYSEFSPAFCRFSLCGDGSNLWCWDPDPWSLGEWGKSCKEDLVRVTKNSDWAHAFPHCKPPPANLPSKWHRCKAYYGYLKKKGVHGKALTAFHTNFWRDVCGDWLSDLKRNRMPQATDYCYFKEGNEGFRDKYAIHEVAGNAGPALKRDADLQHRHHVMEEAALGCPVGVECEVIRDYDDACMSFAHIFPRPCTHPF